MLQDAEDNYYMTASYLVEFAQKAYDLFKSSEVEERRQLIKLVLSNLRIEGELVRYEVKKPYNTIINYADRQAWLPLVDAFRNREIEIEISLTNIQTLFETYHIQPAFAI